MRAQAESSIVVAPCPMWSRLFSEVQARRWAAAAMLSLLVLFGAVLSPGSSAPLTPAAADAMGPVPASTANGRLSALYPLAPLPRPAGGPIPLGKGMWLYVFNRAEGGVAQAVVERAKAAGLTHLYVRLGSSWDGFYGGPVLDRLLPAAHAAGLKVVGWDFPSLANPYADAERSRQEIWYATPGGQRIDGFSADIETPSEGTRLSDGAVAGYGQALRAAAGDGYPLIATVPRPGGRPFPYASLTSFDAIAPMVYWGKGDPVADVTRTLERLAPYGKPVLPVGQAYDMALDGGPRGNPSKADLARFTKAAADHGALGVSFWVWDTATSEQWAAVREATHFDLGNTDYLKRVLTGLGHPTLSSWQQRNGLSASGQLDAATTAALLAPR